MPRFHASSQGFALATLAPSELPMVILPMTSEWFGWSPLGPFGRVETVPPKTKGRWSWLWIKWVLLDRTKVCSRLRRSTVTELGGTKATRDRLRRRKLRKEVGVQTKKSPHAECGLSSAVALNPINLVLIYSWKDRPICKSILEWLLVASHAL